MLGFALATLVFIPGGTFLMGTEPRTKVTVAPFYLDKYEVTNEQFQFFVREHPEYTSKLSAGGPEHPVALVTWFQARAYCTWQGKRLPTEAEWEYAARSGKDDAEHPWGAGKPTAELANYAESKLAATVRVGTYPPNAFGVHDMAGNVWEFTAESSGAGKVIRGGSFQTPAEQLRVSARESHKADDPVAHVGFRCARDQ